MSTSSNVSNNSQTSKITVTLASFWKRLIAWVYDLLGGLAVFILALVLGYLIVYIVSMPWVENAEQVSSWLSSSIIWPVYLFLCVQYFYAWCWVKGGQSLGMRTWRLKICKPNGDLLTWKEAYIRTIVSLGGIGTLWCLVDDEKRGLQDIAINSRVVQLPKGFNQPQKPLI